MLDVRGRLVENLDLQLYVRVVLEKSTCKSQACDTGTDYGDLQRHGTDETVRNVARVAMENVSALALRCKKGLEVPKGLIASAGGFSIAALMLNIPNEAKPTWTGSGCGSAHP